ncbi:hypothetical protein A9Q79_00470 [Methylophaga sp. 42_25_T18]|nr:hypothetical protein A9Q79_00470 [Methylophaga sp. 42_25_T18]
MGRLVTSGNDIVWKYVVAEQSSEMYRVPIDVGVGEHVLIKYTHDAMRDEEVTYEIVDPEKEEFEADILKLKKQDLSALKGYVSNNTTTTPWYFKFIGKKTPENHFVNMVAAFADYVELNGDVELFGEM